MSSQDQEVTTRSCPVADSVSVSSQVQDVAARSCPVADNVSSQDQDVTVPTNHVWPVATRARYADIGDDGVADG